MAKASKTPSAFCLFFLIFGIFNFNRNFKQVFSLSLFKFFNSCFRLTLLLSYTNRVNTEKIIIRLLFSFLKYGWNIILLFHQTLHITVKGLLEISHTNLETFPGLCAATWLKTIT